MSAVPQCKACGQPLDERHTLSCTTQQGAVVNYVRCEHCGLMAMHPFPSAEQISGFYDASYYGLGETKFVGGIEHLRLFFCSGRARAMVRHQRGAGRKILDIGCGSGTFLAGLSKRGFAVYGTELEGPAFERARRVPGITLHKGELTDDTFAGERFDVITIWHVLEHVAEPADMLRICRDLLTDDGKLFLEVPNVGSWQGSCSGAHWLHLDPPRHLYQFTEESLTSLMNGAGFEVESCACSSMEMGVIGILQSWLNAVLKPRDLFFDILRTRNRCPGAASAKISSVVLAALLMVPAILFAIVELGAGKGAVLRIKSCKVRP